MLRQVNYAPLVGGGTVIPQLDDYTYDTLNRVKSVTEAQQASNGAWTFNVFTQTFDYDRWGNRTINLGATTSGITGVTRKNFVVDAATNRLTSVDGVGMTYDVVGNQTNDATGDRYYDSENRMTKAVQSGQSHYYFYDANGKRVRRIVNGSQTWNGQETWFVYGFDGELVAEYAYNQVNAPLATLPQKEYGYRGGKLLVVWDGTQTGDKVLKWMVTDHLGSTRLEVDQSGSLAGMGRHDYLPFGEELLANTGAQRSGIGYEPPTSNVKQKFGSKERDTETGLDFFGARYFGSTQGRFTSADSLLSSATIYDPQSWNRYSYTLNNPLKYNDPFGLYVYAAGTTAEEKKKFEQGLKDLQKARDSFKKGSAEYNRLGRAFDAYGAKNVDNGVTVAFGATADGTPAHAVPGLKPADANGMKTVTADNPTGQDITVTFDPAQHKDGLDYATSVGHEGSHVADISAVVAALPNNLLDPAAQAVLNGPLNLTSYATERSAYEVTSFIAQARMVAGSNETKFLTIGAGKYEIWNTGWSAADRATKRAAGIDRALAEPKSQGGKYGVTPQNPGQKLF